MAKRLGKQRKLPEYTSRGCNLTKNDSKWCNRMCTPDPNGYGTCGRIAPHALTSRLQAAIKEFNLKNYGTEKVEIKDAV